MMLERWDIHIEYMYTYIYVYVYVYICIYIQKLTYEHINLYNYICMYVYTYMDRERERDKGLPVRWGRRIATRTMETISTRNRKCVSACPCLEKVCMRERAQERARELYI